MDRQDKIILVIILRFAVAVSILMFLAPKPDHTTRVIITPLSQETIRTACKTDLTCWSVLEKYAK